MKRLTSISFLIVSLMLGGCSRGASTAAVTPVTPSSPTASVPDNIAGNWQFNTAPGTSTAQAVSIAGNISQTGTQVTGAFHVNGSNCFNRLTVRTLTGTVSSGNTTLTSTATDGQTITFTGQFGISAVDDTHIFAGTYSVSGGCDAGDQGTVTGDNIPDIPNDLSGVFTNSAQTSYNMSGGIAQNSSADPTGSYGLSGNAAFVMPCFSTTAISPGVFPSGSYILGTSVELQFAAGNGIVTFSGMLNQDTGQVAGTYAVSGGPCDGVTGTAVLQVNSPWDY